MKRLLFLSLIIFSFSTFAFEACEELNIESQTQECEMLESLQLDARFAVQIATGYHDLEEEIYLTAYDVDPHSPIKTLVLVRENKDSENYKKLMRYIVAEERAGNISVHRYRFAD